MLSDGPGSHTVPDPRKFRVSVVAVAWRKPLPSGFPKPPIMVTLPVPLGSPPARTAAAYVRTDVVMFEFAAGFHDMSPVLPSPLGSVRSMPLAAGPAAFEPANATSLFGSRNR